MDQIIAKTMGHRREDARLVKVVQFKAGRDRNGFAYAAAQTYSTHRVNVHGKIIKAQDRSKYVSKIAFIDKKLNVKVLCSCNDFCFVWNWALHRKGAAELLFSTGDPPDQRNPTYRPGCCKHLIALRELIKKKYNF